MTSPMLPRVLPLAAIALVVTSWSETLYYPTDSPLWLLALWYVPVVVVTLDLVASIPTPRVHHAILAGWLYGALAEGTVVPVLYTEAPISFLAPVLGWHMAVTVLVGLVGWGAVLRARRWWVPLVAVAATGIALGAWWTVWTIDGAFGWVEVLRAVAVGSAGAALGHAVLRANPVRRPPVALVRGCWVGLVLLVALQSLAIPWAAPVMALAAGVPVVLLRRARRSSATSPRSAALVLESTDTRHAGRALWLAPIPVVAAATFALLTWGLGAAGAADLALGIGGGVQMVGGPVLAVWAVAGELRTRGSAATRASAATGGPGRR